MSNYWGYHLMYDCSGCSDAIKDKAQIYKFIKELVKKIDMVAHGEPIIEYLLPGEDKAGYSMMQLITTSNICAHFVEPDATAYLDVFSCKEFDIKMVEKIFKKYFKPDKIRMDYITRHAD